MTPKKSKADSRMVRPRIESPGGPQVVRSTTFACMGYVVFSLQAINRKHWSLNNVSIPFIIYVKYEVVVETFYESILTRGDLESLPCLIYNTADVPRNPYLVILLHIFLVTI